MTDEERGAFMGSVYAAVCGALSRGTPPLDVVGRIDRVGVCAGLDGEWRLLRWLDGLSAGIVAVAVSTGA